MSRTLIGPLALRNADRVPRLDLDQLVEEAPLTISYEIGGVDTDTRAIVVNRGGRPDKHRASRW